MESDPIFEQEIFPDGIGFRVARLGLWLDSEGSGVILKVPAAHKKFLEAKREFHKNDLVIRVNDVAYVESSSHVRQLFKSEARGLWLDKLGNYVFDSMRHTPAWRIVIQSNFSSGDVFGDYSHLHGNPAYPLLHVDIIIYANWLAKTHDIILHAAGITKDGRGYCFAGVSGSGKSTLADHLKKMPGIRILGEDQVVLRYLDGQFWIFGTPWHENPEMCFPGGARLEKIFFLNRNGALDLERLSATDGITRILQTAFIPYYRTEVMPGILERLSLLAEHIPFLTLRYKLGSDVSELIF